ncbi:MAG: TRAP transporter large permease [Methylocystaceae bacterium]|nr:TRAP transporter large permease [Methylocystaceae bacterium]
MDRLEIGIIGIIATLILIAARMQVGVVLGIVSFVGISALTNTKAAWGIVTAIPHNFIAQWSLSAVPMFLVMGYLASQTGLTKGLFSSARILLGRIPGGLASASVIASAMFASASGSSVATAAAFSRIAVPEMLKSNYKPCLSTGVIAASGTLGSLIPPSVLMILYGIFTETSIGALFVGGIIPGILSAIIYVVMITMRAKADPELAPLNETTYSTAELIAAIKDIWPLPTLILGVLGGMFAGIFTPTEGGAIGAFIAALIALSRKSLNVKAVKNALFETAEGTCAVFFIAIGASMFSKFMGLSTVPTELANTVLPYVDSPVAIILASSVLFIILGMFVDGISLMLLTIPIVLPVLTQQGVDLVWYGIIMIKLLEIGLITPPVGMNVYVIKSALGSKVELTEIFKGTFWFLGMDILTLILLVLFPSITLFLPSLMN